ncbi:ribonuclease H-like domain-containing protein [Tanacetum coccineum]
MKINHFKQNGLPVFEYYHKLNSLWRDFDILTKLSPCTCDAKSELGKHNQLMKLIQFLMGLDDVYLPIRSSLLTQTELPDVKDAFVIVYREESHKGLGSGTGVQKPTVSSFVSKNFENQNLNQNRNNNNNSNNQNVSNNQNNTGFNNQNNKGQYNSLSCKNYGMKGHTIDRCFEIIGYLNGFKRNQNGKNSSNNKGYFSNNVDVRKSFSFGMPFTSDQIAKLMSLIGDKPSNGIHANMAGANQHITSSTNNMTNVIDILELNITVGHPNGTTAKIRKLVRDSKLHVVFDEYDCIIQDLKRENILGTGSEAGGLYVFNTESSSPNDDEGEPSGSNIGSESESDDTVRYGLDKFANHTWLSIENCRFIANINMSFEPKSYEEVVLDKNWVQAMNDEIEALYENNSWDLFDLPKNRNVIGSKWVYKIKHKSTWEIDRYKARLVAKWFNQREGIDYEETFSPVVKMGTDVYMLSPPGYYDKNEIRVCKLKRSLYGLKQAPKQWNNRFFEALVENDFKQSGHDHSLYTKESGGSFVALLVYVDDIVLTGNNINEINKVKTFLKSKFKIKDLGELKYFLGIEYIQAPLQSHMDIALRVLRYLKGALGSGVNYEKSEHMSLKVYVDSDWAKCPVTRRSVSGYCVSMAAATCELMRVVNILKDLKVTNLLPAELFCENRATIQIAANPVMHEKTKHFDLDIHIIREKVASGLIKTAKIDSENQTADIFTKALGFPQHRTSCVNFPK